MLSIKEAEKLRELLDHNLKMTAKEYSSSNFKIIPLFILTTDIFNDATKNLMCPHSKFVNPYCFLANEFLIAVDFEDNPFSSSPVFFNLDERFFSKSLMNVKLEELFKIGIIPEYEWVAFLKATADHEAIIFINHYVNKLHELTGIWRFRYTLVAILKGTHSETIIPLLERIPAYLRKWVQEIALDLAASMSLIVKRCFPHAQMVIDRFHVQQLATEALQEIRIQHRWQAIEADNQAIDQARINN